MIFLHIRQGRPFFRRPSSGMCKEPIMPMRHWALTTVFTSVVVVTFAADSQAQNFGKSRLGAPHEGVLTPKLGAAAQRNANTDPVSIGLVEGLPDENDVSLSLAQLAAESNLWMPVCEPPGPTRGLWVDCQPTAPGCSWQECVMVCRDGLGWVFTRPTCVRGVYAASDASAWDWVMQWMPRLGAASSGPPAMCTCTTDMTIESR
jgi:hypothetical protein